MSYEKQTWATGDTITETKLNHMEDGIATGGGVLVVNLDMQTMALDHTWQEVFDAPMAVLPFATSEGNKVATISAGVTKVSDSSYQITFVALTDMENPMVFDATSADGYPVAQKG